MRILIIDNYDSFTYNLVQRIGELDASLDMHVIRNDQITQSEAEDYHPTHLVLSPGPGRPVDSGICPDLIRCFKGRIPILGVCLGHQTLADLHGMTVKRHDILMHGKTSLIHHDGHGIFANIPNPFQATRYHSLIVDGDTISSDFQVSAWTADNEIMGLRWIGDGSEDAPLTGVQFHPESFLTTHGSHLLANFLGLPR